MSYTSSFSVLSMDKIKEMRYAEISKDNHPWEAETIQAADKEIERLNYHLYKHGDSKPFLLGKDVTEDAAQRVLFLMRKAEYKTCRLIRCGNGNGDNISYEIQF